MNAAPDWQAIATEALENEGSAAYQGRTIDQLAAALEAGHEAGSVIYDTGGDYTEFRVMWLPGDEVNTEAGM